MSVPSVARVRWSSAEVWRAKGSPALLPKLDGAMGAGLRAFWSAADCERLASRVEESRALWTSDFNGEQFALGRAFYTHLETGRAHEYFSDARASDARVEGVLPGMQAGVRALFASLVGGIARARPGFCGAGVHVFPAGEKVAREGGVVHFDTEGLTPHQLRSRARALSLVLMVRPGEGGAGLRLWDVLSDGASAEDEGDAASTRVKYRAGDALLFDSYRLHQILPFAGARARISITLHGVEVDRGCWETWF